ncbi:unnamed protein product [Urochloa decumbens]|uniref:Uncharacterized protein n=1 Tax=Urochloa decumbens TaxID=240449 RepID=A0ABC9FMJ3_9POAL
MIRRRFVNLVAEDYSTGARSLHRLDAAKHIFYPSTARAEAAHAKEEDNSNGAAVPKPTSIRRLRPLPPPSLRFPAGCSVNWRPPLQEDDKFMMPLYEDTFRRLDNDKLVLLSHHSSEGKILHASGDDGWTVLYDAGSGSATTMPSIGRPLGSGSTFISVAGVGEEEGSLYVMTDHYGQHSFQVLDFNQCPPLKWEPLPLPPFKLSYTYIRSFTTVDGGDTICMSTTSKGTYCFNTASHEWSKAGDWVLPFHGRAEYIPELGTWIGLHSYMRDHQLCACSNLAAAIAEHRGSPTLQHKWKYLTLPPYESGDIVLKGRLLRGFCLRRLRHWSSSTADLLNFGGGRFCIATVVRDERTVSFSGESETMIDAAFVVLNDVEVVRDGDDEQEGGLRMVKHKSRRYMFTNHKIQWVL